MKRTLFYLTVFVFAFTGCSEFEEPERIAETDEVVASATATPQTRAGAANVFEQMANPYSLALMRQLKNNPSLTAITVLR